MTQPELAERLGMSTETIKRVERQDVAGVGTNLLPRIAETFGLSLTDAAAEFLAESNADVDAYNSNADREPTRPPDNSREGKAGPPARRAPHYRSVSAVRKDLRIDDDDDSREVHTRDAEVFTVTLDGACMRAPFHDGAEVLCSVSRWKSEGFVDGKVYWIRFADGESTFKRVEFGKDRDWLWLVPDDGERWKVHRSEVALAARAVSVMVE